LLGELPKGAERAYTMYLNKMRVDLFNRFADSMQERGLTWENSKESYEELSKYINNSTGRGTLGKTLNEAAPLLNSLFFSPRLIASRVNMITNLATMPFRKSVPKEVIRDYYLSMAKFVGVGMVVLGLAKLNGEDVESDPRSPDFGKIKSGNTRWDIWGGFQQYARLAAVVMTEQKKSSTTGEIRDIDKGNVKESRLDILSKFGRGKLSPIASIVTDILDKKDIMGNKLTTNWTSNEGRKEKGIGENLSQHLLPLTLTGFVESLNDQGGRAWLTTLVPSIFGIGTQTYGGESGKPANKRDLKYTIDRNTLSESIDYKDIKNYKAGGRAITESEFETYAKKRDEKIAEDIKKLYDGKAKQNLVVENENVVTKKYSEMTEEQIVSALTSIKSTATREIKEELFGEKKKTRREKRAERLLEKKKNKFKD